jgi:predicted HAD superfamily Cof-like phosphohydrolase
MYNMSISELMRFQKDRGLHKNTYDWENETMNIVEELLEAKGYDVPKKQRESFLKPLSQYLRSMAATNPMIMWLRPSSAEMVDAFADIIVFCVGAIMKLGYDPEKVLVEVAKEVNSRKGRILNGKFEKYTKSEPEYEETYKAQYSTCTLKKG